MSRIRLAAVLLALAPAACGPNYIPPVQASLIAERIRDGVATYENDIRALSQIEACGTAPTADVAAMERYVSNLAWQRIPRLSQADVLRIAENAARTTAFPTAKDCADMRGRWAQYTMENRPQPSSRVGATVIGVIRPTRQVAGQSAAIPSATEPVITRGTGSESYDRVIATFVRLGVCGYLSPQRAVALTDLFHLRLIAGAPNVRMSFLNEQAIVAARAAPPPTPADCVRTVPREWAAVRELYRLPSIGPTDVTGRSSPRSARAQPAIRPDEPAPSDTGGEPKAPLEGGTKRPAPVEGMNL